MAGSWTPSSTDSPVTIDRGYFVTIPQMSPDDGSQLTRGANAKFTNSRDEMIGMWVNDFSGEFGLEGTLAQSRRHRSFYPHNLVVPTLTISGQTPNSYEYNRLMLFIRSAQRQGLDNPDDILTLVILKGGESTQRRIQRGDHNAVKVTGYIEKVTMGAERFVNAPTYTLTFVPTNNFHFIGLDDTPFNGKELEQSITGIFTQNIPSGATLSPDQPKNTDTNKNQGQDKGQNKPNNNQIHPGQV
jgi:hypothetical protein